MAGAFRIGGLTGHNPEALASAAASSDSEGAANDAAIQLVTFFLAGEEYALAITRIREIIGITATTRLPHALPHVRGLINLRGEVIPVLDLRVRFALKTEPTTPAATIIAEWQGETFGFTVDSVHQVVWLPTDRIDPPSSVIERQSPYVKGLGKYQDRLLILLDLDALFGDGEDESSR